MKDLSIKAQFEEFIEAVASPKTSFAQIEMMQNVFHSGFFAAMVTIQQISDMDLPDEKKVELLSEIRDESKRFFQQFYVDRN